MKTFQRILVATDFSAASMPAFEQAVALAKESGAELLIANVHKEAGPLEAAYAPEPAYEQWREQARARAHESLQSLLQRARREGLGAEGLILVGFPDKALVEAAEHHGADLIVLGTHGRLGAERFFLGSVAARVVSTAPCPVMTVRAR